MEKPKMLGKVTVPTHTRKNDGGGVSIIKQYTSLRELSIPEAHIGNFKKKADTVRSEIFNENGNLNLDMNTAEKKVIDLYSSTIHNGVDAKELNDENCISKLFDSMNQMYNNVEDPKLIDNFSWNIYENVGQNIMNILTHPDFIDSAIKKTSEIKKSFEHNLGVKTEIVDPFSFKFEADVVHHIDSEVVSDELNKTGVISNISKLMSDNPDFFDKDHLQLNQSRLSNLMLRFSREGLLKNRKATSTLIPTIILSSFASSIKGKRISMSLSDDFFSSFMPNMDCDDLISGNPAEMRKTAIKITKGNKDISKEEKNDVLSALTKVEDKHIVPLINLVRNSDVIPNFFLDKNNNIFESIQKISEKTRGTVEKLAPKHSTRDIYISKNPLAILTMSSYDRIPSCQSLRGEDGKLHLGGLMRINIPGTINTHRTNDFIMYTTNDKGQKTARASLSHNTNSNKYEYFEHQPIYGDEYHGQLAISSVLVANNKHFEKNDSYANVKYPNTVERYKEIKDFREKTNATAKQMEEKITEVLENIEKDPNKKDTIKVLNTALNSAIDESKKQANKIGSSYAKFYSNHISETISNYPTFLYGAKTSSYLSDLSTRLIIDLHPCINYESFFENSISMLKKFST